MSLKSLKVDLTGQTAIVTGASQGLGRAMAIALAASGARVACVARNVKSSQRQLPRLLLPAAMPKSLLEMSAVERPWTESSNRSPKVGDGWTSW